MNTDQLHQFDAVVRNTTISAAATELGMSQSALSRSIARLEDELGVSLFKRKGKRLSLSSDGALLMNHVSAILAEERLLFLEAAELSSKTRTLTVCSVAPAPLWLLTALALERFPSQIITSRLESQEVVERKILNREVDLGISLKPINYPSIRCVHLMDEELFISVSRGHKLAHKEMLESEDIDGYTMLMLEQVGFWASTVQEAFPRTEFVIQQDSEMLRRMESNPEVLMFASDAPYQRKSEGRVLVPLNHPCMHASFYLLVHAETTGVARDIFDIASIESH